MGTKGNPEKSWREQEDARKGRGEYEPRDARNATDQSSSETDRWENENKEPPDAAGTRPGVSKGK